MKMADENGKMTLQDIQCLMRKQDRFKVIDVLGKGAFGTVFLSEDVKYGNELIAIKFVDAPKDRNKHVIREIENHRKLRHPHVIEFRRIFSLPGKLSIVMEYANGGNLFNYVRTRHRVEESLARWFFQQLMVAVDYCHRKGVANRDIKLENILLSEGEFLPILKLCDFGYSKHDSHSVAKSIVGSVDYMAPEVLQSKAYDAKLADTWSCGVVLYVMLKGMYPFQTAEVMKIESAEKRRAVICERIKRLEYTVPSNLSADCQDLLKSILTTADKRISIGQIMDHPWCQKNFPPDARLLNDRIMAMDRETMQQVEEAQSAQQISNLIETVPSKIEKYDFMIDEALNEYIDEK
ncbi:hypothetical protein BSKO_07409 [Bryopsis sp. KO-2023]|nr:hypothetical protein BSKO_07409 [Bryopsis sp. KO-2023]